MSEIDKGKHELAAALLQVNEIVEPIIDHAVGFKAKLMSHGLAEETAEAGAREMLLGLLRMTLGGMGTQASASPGDT